MLGKEQNWEVFGYDTRQLGSHWLAAWRDLLWADDSPVRQRLDEVVLLRNETDSKLFQAGEPSDATRAECEAVLLPEDLVLSRHLRLPLSAEAFLETALQLEVSANSPFDASDTGFGWRLLRRGENKLEILLVIVSISTVMTYLGRQYDSHDPQACEVWADVDGALVVVRGFGEKRREHKYRRRLLRSVLGVGACALLLFCIVALGAGIKRVELGQMKTLSAAVEREAAEASRMRASLALANETVAAVNGIVATYPNPHVEIARLTALLDDDASITQFSMSGRDIRLRGRAADAASVMQVLTDQAAYREVTAPQAIVKVAGTGLEQFSLNIALREGDSG